MGLPLLCTKNMKYHINVLQSNEDMTVKLAWTSKNDCVTMHTMHCNERRVSGGPELRKLIVFLAALLFLLPASAEIYIDQEPPSDWASKDLLRLTVFPAFQNDVFLMECGGESMLIDGGTAQYIQKVQEVLEKRGYGEHLNYIVNSHPHDDHIDCAADLIRRGLSIDLFMSPFPEDYGNPHHQTMVRHLQEKGFPYKQVMDGETIRLGSAEIDCFSWLEAVEVNARSMQMHVRFGNTTLLLNGDLTGKGEHHYLETLDPKHLESDILKAPHHSLVHMVPEYLDTVNPKFVFLINEKNRAKKSENQLAKRNIPHMYNGDGTITMETDGVDWYISQVKGWN